MDTIDRLKQHARILRRIELNERQIEALEEKLTLPATTNTHDPRVQGTQRTDRLPIKLQQIDVLKMETLNLEALVEDNHEELWAIVGSLTSEYEVCVVRSYYFWLLDRDDIAQQIFGDRDDFSMRRHYYLGRVSQLHTQAKESLKRCQTVPMKLGV